MKSGITVAIAIFAIVIAGALAQSISFTQPTTLAGCLAPAAGALITCNVANDPNNPSGEYISANGQPYFLVQSQTTGVTSWNTRKGAVMPALGDYSFSQISGTATAAQLPALSALSGQITPAQLPTTIICNAALGASGSQLTVTLTSCVP
jgi:hypothetical protein